MTLSEKLKDLPYIKFTKQGQIITLKTDWHSYTLTNRESIKNNAPNDVIIEFKDRSDSNEFRLIIKIEKPRNY